MEERTNLNFSIPTELSLKIDHLLINLKEKGYALPKKTKNELLADLLRSAYYEKLKTL